nr:MAG TPA: hypothetical protein [Caudoviricetes sp.]
MKHSRAVFIARFYWNLSRPASPSTVIFATSRSPASRLRGKPGAATGCWRAMTYRR